jgi:septal ring-binding cell division protein DamX
LLTLSANTLTDVSSAKTSIGTNAATDSTSGILVLTDTNKAMVLPKVSSPHLNIISPSSGMMVYDTTAHQLAVFNGTVWSFWKP